MERPNTILGLTSHLARTRWQQLSARGRFFVVVGGAVLAMAGVTGARMAMGGCCSSSCASMRAAHEAALAAEAQPATEAVAEAGAPATSEASTACPYTH